MSVFPARTHAGARSGLETSPGIGSFNRRDLMKLASVAALGASATFAGGAVIAPSAAAAAAQWAGHKPGRIYLGAASYPDSIQTTMSRTGRLGLRRTFYKWGDARREDGNIRADHAAGRLPWISFKPANTAAGGWAAIISGRHDADIRARARRYAEHSGPIIVTFNHEPQTDNTGTPAEFTAAWNRIHDVMKSETGLKNVASVPIIGEWVFNPINRRHEPEDYINQAMLNRCHFLGIDLYQGKNGEGYDARLGRVLNFLDQRGHSTKMVGIGETGATNAFGTPNGATWWSKNWEWASANTDRIGAIAYFNTRYKNRSGYNWLLTEDWAKLNAFRASASSSVSCFL